MVLQIVIVCNPNNLSGDGCSHKCFVGYNRASLVNKAVAVKEAWEGLPKNRSNGESGPYAIFAGELTQRAVVPIKYELVPIDSLPIRNPVDPDWPTQHG